ncbi:MAG: hypothetical protein AB1458_11930 [Bacteroidota bacterium]
MSKPTLHLFTFFACNSFFGGGAIVRDVLKEMKGRFDLKWHYLDEFDETNDTEQWVRQHVACEPIHILRKRRFLYTLLDHYYYFRGMPALARSFAKHLPPGDVVWIILDNKMIPFAHELCRINIKNKIHVSVHDDSRNYYKRYKRISSTTNDYFKRIFSRVDSSDFIGKHMLEEYQKEFGARGIVFRRGVEAEKIQVKVPRQKDTYSLLFAGSSHSNACWVRLVRKLSAFSAEFEILVLGNPAFTQGFEAELSQAGNIRLKKGGTVPDNEIAQHAAHCDLAVFFFDDLAEDRLRFSVSTKLALYGRLGLPMIGYISSLSELKELERRKLAFSLERSEAEFRNWINDFSGEEYKSYFRENFDGKKMMEDLKACVAFT